MKLVVDRGKMLSNIERAKVIVGNASIALMFKEFYSDFYDERFSEYVCFGNDVRAPRRVTANIINKEISFGKVYPRREVDMSKIDRIYIPLNVGDDREGYSIEDVRSLSESLSDYKSKLWLMMTSGCINDIAPSFSDLCEIWESIGHLFSGISIGGSYWLGRELPAFVSEVRIGEYMLFGTIPYSQNKSLLGDCALSVESNVIAEFPERDHILIDCGKSSMDVDNSVITSKGVSLVHSSCEYSVLKKNDRTMDISTVQIIPDYYSLIKLRYADTEYIG